MLRLMLILDGLTFPESCLTMRQRVVYGTGIPGFLLTRFFLRLLSMPTLLYWLSIWS